MDSEGNKILYLNFLRAKYSIFDRLKGHHKDDSGEWKEQRVIVLDGFSYYWSIEINLSQQMNIPDHTTPPFHSKVALLQFW